MDDGAELVGHLLLLEQRRAGKGHVGGQRQRFLHPLMRLAAVAAVAFIDQHDQIRRRVVALWLARGGGELVDQRENDALGTLADTFGQLPPGLRPRLLALLPGGDGRTKSAAADEIARQLVFQINPVGHHHDAAGFQILMDDQRLGQKNHRETLARPRRVPDDTAFPPAIRPALLDAAEQGTDAEKLLVTCHHLADLAVEQDKKSQEFKQPGRRQQGCQQPVLLRRQHRLRPQLFEVIAQAGRLVGKQRRLSRRRQRPVLPRRQLAVGKLLLAPARPELRRRKSRAVAPFTVIHRQQQLGVGEKLLNLVVPLVTQILANSLVDRSFLGLAALRPLRLDHYQRQAIDVTNDIGNPAVRAVGGQHFQFLGHLPAIGRRLGPVDDGDGRLMLLAIRHELGDGDAQSKHLVQPLIGRQQTFRQAQRRQLADNLLDAGRRQRIPGPLVLEAPGLQNLDQPRPQHHLAATAAQGEACCGRQEIPAQIAQQMQGRNVAAELLAGLRDGAHGGTQIQ